MSLGSDDDESLLDVEDDLPDLKYYLGDAYAEVKEEELDGLSDISWGSDEDGDAQTVAPDPQATLMLKAENEDDFVFDDYRSEIEELHRFLGKTTEEQADEGRDITMWSNSMPADDDQDLWDIEEILKEADRDPTPSEVGRYIEKCPSSQKSKTQSRKGSASQRIKEGAVARRGQDGVQNHKSQKRKRDQPGSLKKKIEKKGNLSAVLWKEQEDGVGASAGEVSADECEEGSSGSELRGQQSIRTADFDGLMSEKSASHRSRSGKSMACGRSIHDSDFGALLADCDDLEEQCGLDGEEDLLLGGVQDGIDNREEDLDLEDVLSGLIPPNCSPKQMVEVLEQVLDRNKRLQTEMMATLDSINEAVTNNSKAHQLVEALQSMRFSNLKSARPASSSVLEDGRPVLVNGKIQTSFWSTPDGKHPRLNADTVRLETIKQYIPVLNKFSAGWLLSESKKLCEGLLSHVQELALHAAVNTLENRRGQGQRLLMSTSRSIISEVGALKLDSPISLEMISNFKTKDWDQISRMYVPSRSGYECMLQWNCFTRPDRVTSSFTASEMAKIGLMSAELSGRNWVKIARELGTGRSPTECFRAYIQSLALPSRTWRAEDDQRLLEAVEKHGKGDWGAVGVEVGRTGKACECRYMDVLVVRQQNPEAEGKRDAWSMEEDLHLLKTIRQHGKKWRKVAWAMGTSRKPATLRERYTKYLDPTYNRRPFTVEEKQKLLDLGREEFKQLGRIRWAEVARSLPTKRLPFLVHQVYQHMIKCLEKGKDPFASDPVLRSFEDFQKRLHINIDGTDAVDSGEEGELYPSCFNEMAHHSNDPNCADYPVDNGLQDILSILPQDFPAANSSGYVNQCILQAPRLP